MNSKELKALISDWRIATLLILIVLSVIAIYPHFDQQGHLATNLQYGLDLQEGSSIQLEFRGEVVGFTTDQPLDAFVTNLSKKLDTEVIVVEPTNPNHLEIRKYFSQEDLEPIFTSEQGKITSYQQGVSKSTADLVKRILETKINTLGTKMQKSTRLLV